MPMPVTLMDAGGLPRVNTTGAVPHTVVEAGGVGITLTDGNAPPITLLNPDGTLYGDDDPATTTDIEILTRTGDTILTRDGATVIARAT